MKKKHVHDFSVRFRLIDSKSSIRVKLDSDWRLKAVANLLCENLHLDHISTEWRFNLPKQDEVEIPIQYTMRQIDEAFGRQSIIDAKIMSVKVVDDEIDDKDPKLRFFDYLHLRRRHIKTRTKGTQAEPQKLTKFVNKVKFEEMFSVNGLQRINKFKEMVKFKRREQKRLKSEIWDKLGTISSHKIMRGLGVIGFCSNRNCLNHEKWVMHGLGFGVYSFKDLHRKVICQLCPRKDMHPRPLILVGLFFKDCKWRVRGEDGMDVQVKDGLKPFGLYLNKQRRIRGIQKYLIEDSIFELESEGLVLEVAKLKTFNFKEVEYIDERDKRKVRGLRY